MEKERPPETPLSLVAQTRDRQQELSSLGNLKHPKRFTLTRNKWRMARFRAKHRPFPPLHQWRLAVGHHTLTGRGRPPLADFRVNMAASMASQAAARGLRAASSKNLFLDKLKVFSGRHDERRPRWCECLCLYACYRRRSRSGNVGGRESVATWSAAGQRASTQEPFSHEVECGFNGVVKASHSYAYGKLYRAVSGSRNSVMSQVSNALTFTACISVFTSVLHASSCNSLRFVVLNPPPWSGYAWRWSSWSTTNRTAETKFE